MFSARELQRQKQEAHDHAASLLRSATDAEASVEPLSAEEEVAIIRFYLLRIGKIVKAFGLPSLIEATAMTLMKRFYLRNSCMQFHPKLIMLTSIYLAAKAENYPIPLSHFCAQINKSAGAAPTESKPSAARGDVTESILSELEYGMVLSLDFEVAVHGAHRALYGFILDLQTVEPSLTRDDLMVFAGTAQGYIHMSRLTDAEFHYAPSQIAIAACYMATASRPQGEPLSGKTLVLKWIDAKASMGATLHMKQRHERSTWQQKRQDIYTKGKKVSAFAPASEATAETGSSSEEHSVDYIKENGLGIEKDTLLSIVGSIVELIRSVMAPQQKPEEAPRPALDMERVKSIDLKLRATLLQFDKLHTERFVLFILIPVPANVVLAKSRVRPSAHASIPKTRIPSDLVYVGVYNIDGPQRASTTSTHRVGSRDGGSV
ncbi:transcription factor TFIIK complex [Malassezia pachydermatis]